MTDFTTYPGDRNTRQTPAQRARKMESAVTHAHVALRDLATLCDDFEANGYRLTTAEREEWRTAADFHGDLSRALRAVKGTA